MKSKKILSLLVSLSILGTSFLSFAPNVQAASINKSISTTNKQNATSTSTATTSELPATVTLVPETTLLHVGTSGAYGLVKLSGYVKDSNGNPVDDAPVTINDTHNYGTDGTPIADTRTNKDGYWEIQYAPMIFLYANWLTATVESYNPNTDTTDEITSKWVLVFTTPR